MFPAYGPNANVKNEVANIPVAHVEITHENATRSTTKVFRP